MLEGDLLALFISVVIIPAALLIAVFAKTVESRVMALSLAVLVTGKLWRVRSVVDVHIEPWMAAVFGIHNLPVLIAALVVVAGYCGVAFATVPRRFFWRGILPLAVVLSIVTLFAFRSAYGDAFSPYLSQGGLHSFAEGLAWTLPLLVVLVASLAIVPPAYGAWRRGRSNAPARVAAGSTAALGILGICYVGSKGGYLIVATIDDNAASLDFLKTAGLVTLPLAFLSLGVAVFVPPLMRLSARIRRFLRLLATRRNPVLAPHLPFSDGRSLWALSADPVRAHMAAVGAVDEVILDAEQQPTT